MVVKAILGIAGWLFDSKERWLVIFGMVVAGLGALYTAYSLDREHRLFPKFTQSLIFGITGGVIIGGGLGVFGLLYACINLADKYILHSHLSNLKLPDNTFLIVPPFLLIGLVLGITFGFLVGLSLERINDPDKYPRTDREKRGVFRLAFWSLLVLSVIFQVFILTITINPSAGKIEDAKYFLDIPLFAGCVTSFIFYQRNDFSFAKVIKRIINIIQSNNLFLLFLIVISSLAFIFLIEGLFILLFLLGKHLLRIEVYIYALEFVFGFLITGALNHPGQPPGKPSWISFLCWTISFLFWTLLLGIFGFVITLLVCMYTHQWRSPGKPSWISFFYWTFLPGICGTVVIALITPILNMPYPYLTFFYLILPLDVLRPYILELLVLLGLVYGIERGRIGEFVNQATSPGLRFKNGCIVGVIVFGIYASSYIFADPSWMSDIGKTILTVIFAGLGASIPIGLLLGCIYGLGKWFSSFIKPSSQAAFPKGTSSNLQSHSDEHGLTHLSFQKDQDMSSDNYLEVICGITGVSLTIIGIVLLGAQTLMAS